MFKERFGDWGGGGGGYSYWVQYKDRLMVRVNKIRFYMF